MMERYVKLKKLSVIHCSNLTDVDVTCEELTHLEITNSKYINKVSIRCTKLELLNLSGCSGFLEADVVELIRTNNNLSVLNLCRVEQITALENIKSRKLQSLCLDRCKNLSKLCFEHAPLLESLDISHTKVDDHTLYQMMNEQLDQWLRIKDVKMNGCQALRAPVISNRSVQKLSFDFCSAMERPNLECPKLQELSMNYTHIVDNALESIVRHNEHITNLHARNNMRIVRPKIPADSQHKMEELDLRGCHWLEDIRFTASSSPARLSKMDLSYTRMSDDTIRSVTNNCVGLRDLSLQTCDFLVDPVLESNSLEVLNCKGAHALRSPSIKCARIRDINVENCKNLAVEVKEAIDAMVNLNLNKQEPALVQAASVEVKQKATRLPNVRRRLVF